MVPPQFNYGDMESFMKKMKKIVLVMAIALAAAGVVSAQSLPWGVAQSQSVQGTLGLQNGVIVLSSGNAVYYVPHLFRYVGFIDGLKEGAQVKIEGYSMGNGYLMPSKITVGGKDYDVSSGYSDLGMRHRGGRGYGGGRDCWHW
jgi:hypothetical protein